MNQSGLKNFFGLSFLALALMSTSAIAQIPEAQTGSASAGRVEEQLQPTGDTREIKYEDYVVKQGQAVKVPEGAENVVFSLNTLKIQDAFAYTDEQLREVYGSKLGQEITLADLYGIAEDLTTKYRNDGYILTRIAVLPQTIEDGTATLTVFEGSIDKISIQGDGESEYSLNLIRDIAEGVRKGGSVNSKNLERSLLLINDLPGVSARSVLSPAEGKVGMADLLIIVERDKYEGFVAADNYGTRYLGPLQFSTAASANSVFGWNERITGQAVVAPERFDPELYYFNFKYEMPVNQHGTQVEFFAAHTNTDPGFDLDEFDVEGVSNFAGVTLSHPLIRSRARNLRLRGTLDYRDVDSKNNVETFTREDRIRALRLGANYESLDTLFGAGFNLLDVELSQGMDVLHANDEGDTETSRAAANPDFTKIAVEAQRLQRITPKLNLLVAAKGQLASEALYSSEEFGVGGSSYGRGYDSSEIIGDDGIAGKAELQWRDPYDVALFTKYQVFGFYDGGAVWNKDPATRNLKRDTATSAGAGLRGTILDDTSLDMTIAFPLNRDIATQRDDDPRFYFSLKQGF